LTVLWIFCGLGAPSCTSQIPSEEIFTETQQPSHQIELAPEAIETAGIQTAEVVRARLPQTLESPARIGLNENRVARVGALLDGRIVEVLANVGDRVEERQLLAVLQSHEVDDARAEYAKAKAELERAMSELGYTTKVRDRAARLYELKAGSLEELQRAEAELRRSETQILVARAEIGRLEEHLEHIGVSSEGALDEYTQPGTGRAEHFSELERIPVRSPIMGTVLQRLVTPGTVVSPSDDLFVVSNLSRLWVHAEVPEAYLPLLHTGQRVSVRVESYPGVVFPAQLAHVGDVLNPATRTVQVRCVAENPEGRLRPEMYASVVFDLGAGDEMLVVPKTALQDIDGEAIVFVLTGDGLFERRPVSLGRSAADRVSVLDGLKQGERVVTEGSFLLKSEMLKSRMQEE